MGSPYRVLCKDTGCEKMILISAKNEPAAEVKANTIGLNRQAYIFVPTEDKVERKEVLRGLYNIKVGNMYGWFTYAEQELVCRRIG